MSSGHPGCYHFYFDNIIYELECFLTCVVGSALFVFFRHTHIFYFLAEPPERKLQTLHVVFTEM